MAMKKYLNTGNLQARLNSFLLAYRNTPHATTKETPANLMFGHHLLSELYILKPEVEELVRHQQFIQSSQCSSKARQFAVGDCVLVRNYTGTIQMASRVLWYAKKDPFRTPSRYTRHGAWPCGTVTKISFSWVQLTFQG
ncbi:hypothetical protein MTO96_034801 [Rhipicephalus appendiculatus]